MLERAAAALKSWQPFREYRSLALEIVVPGPNQAYNIKLIPSSADTNSLHDCSVRSVSHTSVYLKPLHPSSAAPTQDFGIFQMKGKQLETMSQIMQQAWLFENSVGDRFATLPHIRASRPYLPTATA